MLPEEHAESSRYLYELASGKFGWDLDKVRPESDGGVQAFHFKLGQGAKTGTGGHLPGSKVQGKIAEVRGLEPGTDAISPSTFVELDCEDDYRRLADDVRSASGGIPVGVKLSAQHIEDDIDAALRVGVGLHHPRRPGWWDRCRAGRVPRPHLGPGRSRRSPGPGVTSTLVAGATSPSSSPVGCAPTPTSPRRCTRR